MTGEEDEAYEHTVLHLSRGSFVFVEPRLISANLLFILHSFKISKSIQSDILYLKGREKQSVVCVPRSLWHMQWGGNPSPSAIVTVAATICMKATELEELSPPTCKTSPKSQLQCLSTTPG